MIKWSHYNTIVDHGAQSSNVLQWLNSIYKVIGRDKMDDI